MYIKNFINAYADALELPREALYDALITSKEPADEVKETLSLENTYTQRPKLRRQSLRRYSHNVPQVIRTFMLIAIVGSLIGYLGFQIKNILEPPRLLVFSPEDGLVTTDTSLTIKGETDPEVQIAINGKSIHNTKQGTFIETLNLTSGINTITISAQKKHGKTTTLTRHVIVKQQPQFSFSNP